MALPLLNGRNKGGRIFREIQYPNDAVVQGVITRLGSYDVGLISIYLHNIRLYMFIQILIIDPGSTVLP